MRRITPDVLRQELGRAITGHRCVQAWLGYGEPLFLGLGEEVLPEPGPDERHPYPRYEIQTECAAWFVTENSEDRGGIGDPREQAQAMCRLLRGRATTGWELDEATWSLSIQFEGDLSLQIVPWSDEEDLDEESWAWALVRPPSYYLEVTGRGELHFNYYDDDSDSTDTMQDWPAESVGIVLEWSDAIEKEQTAEPEVVGESLLRAQVAVDPIVIEAALGFLPAVALSQQRWRDFLLRHLDHDNQRLQEASGRTVAALKFYDAVPSLVRMLDPETGHRPGIAIDALQDLGTPEALDALLAAMGGDARTAIRARSARAVAERLGAKAVPRLEECLHREQDLWIRLHLQIALYRAGMREWLPVILQSLTSDQDELRRAVVDSATALVDRESYDTLVEALSLALEQETQSWRQRELRRVLAAVRERAPHRTE